RHGMRFSRKPKDKDALAGHANGVAHSNAERRLDRIKSAGTQAPDEGTTPPASTVVETGAQRRMAAARDASATFGEIITLLMRAPAYRSLPLGELESLVVPPLRVGQVSVATVQSKNGGATAP